MTWIVWTDGGFVISIAALVVIIWSIASEADTRVRHARMLAAFWVIVALILQVTLVTKG